METPRLRQQDHDRLLRLENYLSSHPGVPINAALLSSEIGASTNTLERLIRNTHGTSLSNYIRSWKLDKAREALETGAVTIAEAAYIAGYGSPTNFSTAFKRKFGLSPSDVQSIA